jgi:hypothetical protein
MTSMRSWRYLCSIGLLLIAAGCETLSAAGQAGSGSGANCANQQKGKTQQMPLECLSSMSK